jgi:hypothetical protein
VDRVNIIIFIRLILLTIYSYTTLKINLGFLTTIVKRYATAEAMNFGSPSEEEYEVGVMFSVERLCRSGGKLNSFQGFLKFKLVHV